MAYTTINKPSDYFNTKLYTGTGSSNSVTGVGFQPDMTWFKHRSGTSEHNIYDAVRGATKRIIPNDNSAEGTQSNGLSAFGSDGFTVVNSNATNLNNETYASWNWKANGAGSANTDGSITSTVSANTTSGFSIGTFSGNATTGATVGHGLGSAPSMVIVKKTNNLGDWYCYHSGIGATQFIKLNDVAASATNTLWNNTAPTSSVFSMDSNSAVNGSGDSYVFYAFAEKQGFSKFGSYFGNGNVDGAFVYTGFKPAWVIVKQTNATGNSWHIKDNKRSSFNVVDDAIYANSNIAEVANNSALDVDFLSNGFKLRNTDNSSNGFGGSTYIYMTFAEQPLVGTNGVTAKGR